MDELGILNCLKAAESACDTHDFSQSINDIREQGPIGRKYT